MRQKLLKKAAAAILSAAVIGGGAFFAGSIGGFRTDSSTITASAEEGSAEIKLTAMGYTLYLRGDITRELVRKYYTRSDIDYVYAAEGCVLPSDCSELFKDYKAPVINLSNADTSNVTNMSQMFNNCPNLVSVYMAGTDTSKVTDMSYLFAVCNKLETVNLDGINTSKVTTMKGMFANCESLTEVNLSGFNTSNVTDMSSMFIYCESLETLDLSSFSTPNVTDTQAMFYKNLSLETIYATPMFDTSNVTSSNNMFGLCDNLVGGNGSMPVSGKLGKDYACVDGVNGTPGYFTDDNFDAATGTLTLRGNVNGDYVRSFGGCEGVKHVYADEGTVFPEYCGRLFMDYKAESIDLSNVDTSKVQDMGLMFKYCENLTSLDLSNFNTSKVVYMYEMFSGCVNLKQLDLGSFNTSKVKYMSAMFAQCSALESVDLSSFDTSNVTMVPGMFENCYALKSLDLRSFNTSKVEVMREMFSGCKALKVLDLSGFDTSNVTDMNKMFDGCSDVTLLYLKSFDTSNVTDMSYMFYECNKLTQLDLSSFDTSNVTDMSYMFFDCNNLTQLDLSIFDTSKVTDMKCMFGHCEALKTLDLSSFDTSNVTDMSNMFGCCILLESVDISSFNTSNVQRKEKMFFSCPKLKTIYASYKCSLDRKVEMTESMFEGCNSLVGGNGTTYDQNANDDYRYAVVDKPEHPGYFTYAPAKFVSNSMTLGGAISLNFYVDLSMVPPENLPFTKVEFTVNGRKQTAKLDPNKMNSKKTAYGFTCMLNSVSMADDVTATVIYYDDDDDQHTVTTVSTAETYLNKFNSSDGAKLWNLIKGINDYGYYMQQYLSKHSASPWTLGVDHKAMAKFYTKPFTFEKNQATYLSELKAKQKEKSLVDKDLSNISYSLVMDSDTAINITVKPQSTYKGSFVFTLDGKKVDAKKVGNNYVITVSGIAAHKLGDAHTLKVKTTNGTSTFKASALSYAYECINVPYNDEEYYAMCALYEYYKAAKAYKG